MCDNSDSLLKGNSHCRLCFRFQGISSIYPALKKLQATQPWVFPENGLPLGYPGFNLGIPCAGKVCQHKEFPKLFLS